MKKLLLAAITVLLIMGCGDDNPSGPETGGEDAAYYPLVVGNQWIYQRDGAVTISGISITTINGVNVTDITGTMTHESGLDVFVQETSLTDTMETGGQSVYLDSTFTTYVRITDQGFYSYVSLFGSDSASVVPFPLQVGAAWQLCEDPPVTAEILSLTQSVTVPAGSFENCLQLRTVWTESGNTVENITDFAPNIGRVKNQYTQTYQSVITSVDSELMSYSLQ